MKKYSIVIMIVFILGLSRIAADGSDQGAKVSSDSKSANKGSSATYIPRPGTFGKPTVRVGGGTRGAGDVIPFLAVLAPEHPGLTVKEKPTLCWFISGKAKTKIEITINDEKSPKPVFEHEFSESPGGGTWCLNLSDYGLALKPDVEYQWFVAIVPDPEHRSKDIVGSGMIKRIEPSKELIDKLSKAKNPAEEVAIQASEGIWYDAISLLTRLLEANPNDKFLRLQRSTLLEQVGLAEAAKFDKD